MKSLAVFADLSLQVDGVHGVVRSTGEVIEVDFESWQGVAAARRAVRSVASWRTAGRWMTRFGLTVQLTVGELLIAEAGQQTGRSGLSIAIGSGWRVWPFHILKTWMLGGKIRKR